MVFQSCLAYDPFGCGPCKPRYKRLVDGIYPPNPYEGGLVKNNMEKLLFFALSSPEKIDKIGKYLAKRLEVDVYRRRNGWIRVSMQALDQLLVSCQAPDQTRNLNLFIESFLTMIRKLLECDEPELQIMAAQSFIKFANIEEDTPSYKRSYDFFISRFSALCYDMSKDLERRKSMRMAGMHGLQGVVRKTVSDDLQVNIWEEQHMSKIVPALIYNMQERYEIEKRLRINNNNSAVDAREADIAAEVAQFAQDCLRDICSRCGYANVMAVIKPALEHHDMHGLWVPGDFAKMCISTMCYALPRQYAYKAVQNLVAHLDQHAGDDPAVKISIIHVLQETVEIASTVGPSVFEVFDALLRHLKRSSSRSQTSPVERRFQLALVNAIGEFAASLPDYQKIEVMQLILDKARDQTSATMGNKTPTSRKGFSQHHPDAVKYASGASLNENYDMQCMLLESLLKVADKYVPQQMSTSFPASLLDLLLPLSISDSKQVRLLVQDIFQSLIDRHFNKKNVGKIRVFDKPVDQQSPAIAEAAEVTPDAVVAETSIAPLMPEKQITSDDARFSRTHLVSILSRMCQYLNISNSDENCYQAVFVTLTLIVLELGGPNGDAVVELLRFCYAAERLFSQPEPGSVKPPVVLLQNGPSADDIAMPKIVATSSSQHEEIMAVDGIIRDPSTTTTEQPQQIETLPLLPPPLPPTDPVLVTSGQQCAAVCLISSIFTLLIQIAAPKLDTIRERTTNIISERMQNHRYLLPENVFPGEKEQKFKMELAEFERNCNEQRLPLLVTEETLTLLAAGGIDVEKVRKPLPVHKIRDGRESPVGGGGLAGSVGVNDRGGLDASSVNISLELESDASSLSAGGGGGGGAGGTEAGTAVTYSRRGGAAGPHPDSIRFETFKKILDEPIENIRAEKQRRQREIWRTFQETPVEELIHMVEMRRGRYTHTLDELLKTPSQSSQRSSSNSSRSRSTSSSDSNNSTTEAVAADTPPPVSATRRHHSMFRGGAGGPAPFKHFEPPDVLTY